MSLHCTRFDATAIRLQPAMCQMHGICLQHFPRELTANVVRGVHSLCVARFGSTNVHSFAC